jgi:phage regulator Rha-like protein
MKQIKSARGEDVFGVTYPYINGHKIKVLKDDAGYFVEREYINGDNPDSRFYRINKQEFSALDAVEYDGARDSDFAQGLLDTFKELLGNECDRSVNSLRAQASSKNHL